MYPDFSGFLNFQIGCIVKKLEGDLQKKLFFFPAPFFVADGTFVFGLLSYSLLA
jgi:hypothetical protein